MDIEWIISECAARNHSADFDQDFRFAIWPASMVHPTASVGAFFHSFHPERLRQPRKGGPALPPPGTENPEVHHTKRFLIHLSVSPFLSTCLLARRRALSGPQGQRRNPPHHASQEPPSKMN